MIKMKNKNMFIINFEKPIDIWLCKCSVEYLHFTFGIIKSYLASYQKFINNYGDFESLSVRLVDINGKIVNTQMNISKFDSEGWDDKSALLVNLFCSIMNEISYTDVKTTNIKVASMKIRANKA